MDDGIIYILQNAAMPGFVKIGKTSTSVEQRMKELDSSGVPLPFECFHASRVTNVNKVEKLLHDAFGDHRVRLRREFFKIDPERIRSALLLAELQEVTPKDDVIETQEDQEALDKERQLRGAFKFGMVKIYPGSVLTFSKDSDLTAVVLDDKMVNFEGEVLSLSASALKIIQRMGYTWKQIAGPSYWEYEGETLSSRRLRLEETAYASM